MERSVEGLHAPDASSFFSQAKLAFDYSLKNMLWKQAAFFAERLVAERPCDETTYLLGLAYFHNQETARAQFHLQGNKLPEARYLLAKCCLQLKSGFAEAEEALLPSSAGGNLENVVNGAAGIFLLGQVQERQSRRERAVECYAKCLEHCPFMWEAYERWSWLVLGSPSPSRSSTSSLAPATFSDEKFAQTFASLANAANQASNGLSPAPAAAPVRGSERALAPSTRSSAVPGRSQNAPPRNDQLLSSKSLQTRRERRDSTHSSRSLESGPSQKELLGRRAQGTAPTEATSPTSLGGPNGNESLSLASLLCKLGIALHAMHSFDCQQTVQQLTSLPKRHFETGYILDLVGLCHFESADYKKSEQAYQQAWRIEPRRMEGLEYYASALWHLRKDVELGRLAQQCLQWDRLKPQVWCVVGNCFSLQKEHDVAIKFFKRAIQVDSSFAYAYTLCGHEFVASEKFDKAISMYETALHVDPRHYNAWWGLGNIYHRQEEHENAKYHFMKALQVNGSNSVLRCYLGMVFESLKQPLLALESFDKAAQSEPQNGMAYFQKACVLMTLERYEEALADLKKVRCLAPKEACVHFQLGKVYMRLQKDRKALFHFNIAMDLNRDSKDYHTIKTHIENLHIRGVVDADATGSVDEHHLNTLAAAASKASQRIVVAPTGSSVFASQHSYQGLVPAGGSPVGGVQGVQPFFGLSPSGPRPAAADAPPQTPAAVRGPYTSGMTSGGGLWSAGGSGSGGPPARGGGGYPGTRTGAGSGRGGTPQSWASVPGTPAAGSRSGTLHGPSNAYRI